MAVCDVNDDGLNDVIASLQAHGVGLTWFEQKRDSAGKISFVKHVHLLGQAEGEARAAVEVKADCVRAGE